jgi:hypothetical protein
MSTSEEYAVSCVNSSMANMTHQCGRRQTDGNCKVTVLKVDVKLFPSEKNYFRKTTLNFLHLSFEPGPDGQMITERHSVDTFV